MNRIILIGRLTKDPDVRYTPNQKIVTSFTLAVDRPYKNQDGTKTADFLPVVVWGKAAELAGNSLGKGHKVMVEGRVQTRTYVAKDNTNRYVTEVISQNIEFLEKKADLNKAAAAQPQQAAPAPQAPRQDANRRYAPQNQQKGYYPNGGYNNNAPRQGGYQSAPSTQQGGYHR